MPIDKRLGQIRHVDLFTNLTESELALFANVCQERRYESDTIIFIEHTPGDELFVILEGEVSIQLELVNEDDAMPLITLGAGDVFGEVSLLDDAPRSATARSLTPVLALIITKTDFQEIIERDHEIGYTVMKNISRIICQRIRATNQKILDSVSWGMI